VRNPINRPEAGVDDTDITYEALDRLAADIERWLGVAL
jgi:hypothetical protein